MLVFCRLHIHKAFASVQRFAIRSIVSVATHWPEMACKTCTKVVSDKEGVICRGPCKSSYHILCVGLDVSYEVLEANKKNLFWMCDGCADMFSSEQSAPMSSHDNANEDVTLQSLKNDISGLKEVVYALSTKLESKPLTPSLKAPRRKALDSFPIPNTSKRIRDDGMGTKFKAKTSNMRGSKTASELVKTVAPPEEMIWIYLSAFHPSTTESGIAKLVKECIDLGTDTEPKVVKLVPKDKDPGTLTFVTFKVGVSKKLKEVALSQDTWPENIFFREFDNYLNNNRRVIRIASNNSQPGGSGQ